MTDKEMAERIALIIRAIQADDLATVRDVLWKTYFLGMADQKSLATPIANNGLLTEYGIMLVGVDKTDDLTPCYVCGQEVQLNGWATGGGSGDPEYDYPVLHICGCGAQYCDGEWLNSEEMG